MKIVLSVASVLAFFAFAACGAAAKAPREQAHASVLLVAEAVRQVDVACATIALARRDVHLATSCDEGYGISRNALIAAEAGVEGWDAADSGNVPCAAARALEGLDRIVGALTRAGGSVPPVVADAKKLVTPLTAACVERKGS